MYEYGNIEDTKVGDIVEWIGQTDSYLTENKLYIYLGEKWITNDKNSKGRCSLNVNWKLIRTKHGSEAKTGDKYIIIDNPKGLSKNSVDSYYTPGMIFTMGNKSGSDGVWANPKPSGSHYRKNIRVLCQKAELESANGQSLIELSELYESGTKLQYRRPGQRTWCGYNDDKNRPDLKTEYATEYEYKVAGNPFKTGDRVRSLTHGGSYRSIGSEHTVYAIDEDKVYYRDGLATDHENFELIEKVVESNSEPKEFEDDNIQYLDSYENFKVGQTIYRTATGQVGLAQGYHTRLLAIRREGSRINLELIDSNGLTRKSCTIAAWKPAGVQPKVESEKISNIPEEIGIAFQEAYAKQLKGNIMQENISITMTAKEFAKHQANPEPKVKTDLQLEKKKPFSAKVFDENGKYSKRLFAKTNPKLEDLISEHLHRNNFDVIIDSTTHKTHTLKRQPVEVK